MKTKKLKMNVRLLRRIQKRILAEPRQFQMLQVFSNSIKSGRKIPHCGTAACIVGWGIALRAKLKPSLANEAMGDCSRKIKTTDEAKIFDLERDASARLVYFDQWPRKFRKIPEIKEGTAAFARQAARRIDHFIKTGE